MRKRWFMKAQIIDILKEHQAGLSAAETPQEIITLIDHNDGISLGLRAQRTS